MDFAPIPGGIGEACTANATCNAGNMANRKCWAQNLLDIRAAKRLVKKGARLLVPPESFLVTGMEGPLAEGELARAHTWATTVRAAVGLPEQEPAGAAAAEGKRYAHRH